MKRIDVTIQATISGSVSDALTGLIEGFSIQEENRRSSEKRQTSRTVRETGSVVVVYYKITTINIVVDDLEVEKAYTAIIDADFTKKGKEGIIATTNVKKVTNIATKRAVLKPSNYFLLSN